MNFFSICCLRLTSRRRLRLNKPRRWQRSDSLPREYKPPPQHPLHRQLFSLPTTNGVAVPPLPEECSNRCVCWRETFCISSELAARACADLCCRERCHPLPADRHQLAGLFLPHLHRRGRQRRLPAHHSPLHLHLLLRFEAGRSSDAYRIRWRGTKNERSGGCSVVWCVAVWALTSYAVVYARRDGRARSRTGYTGR